jgi:hypothetical protein
MPTNTLLEPSPYEIDQGNLIGRDPRKLTEAEVLEAGIELRVPTKAIRAMCLECCGHQEAEVRKCVSVNCPLWALRMTGMSRELRRALKVKAALEKDESDGAGE